MNKYEQALEQSIEYFDGDELAAKVFLDKYALRDASGEILEMTPEDMHRRMAKEFARIEKSKFKTPMTEDEIFALFDRFKWIVPQGSPMFGIGNNYQVCSLANCYVVDSPVDSYAGILRVDEHLAQISKRRGGVGVDLSTLRPVGSTVLNAARTSTGVPSWMERFSNTIREVGQSGRRGALMETIDVAHPDIEEFITIKNDNTKVTGANISVRLSDEFMQAVETKSKFRLRFPVDAKEGEEKVVRWVDAIELWNKIIHNAWLRAEPGILFWDKITSYNAVDCYGDDGFTTISINPCGELALPKWDSCRLMVLNLFSYVDNPFTKNATFNFDLLREHAIIIQRLMDDMVDLELEKIDQILAKIQRDGEPADIKRTEKMMWEAIKRKCSDGRRTGVGVTAEGDAIAGMGLKYGSPKSISLVEEIHKTIMVGSFRSSVDMARELGAFPVWNWDKEKDSEFLYTIKECDPKLYSDIRKYGRRNIANLTIAPTGTVSLLTQTTSGIEPLFTLDPYIRRKKINPNDDSTRTDYIDQNGDHWQEFKVYHPKVKMWMDITGIDDVEKSPWFGSCANDINWVSAIKLQATAQKYIDHSISKTVNLPNNVTEDEVAKIYRAAWKYGCKGATVYRDGCRSGVLIREGGEEIEEETRGIAKVDAPKRPKELDAEAHVLTVKGHQFYVVVGLYGNDPYEIFTGENHVPLDNDGELSYVPVIPKNNMKGKLVKISRGKYAFVHGTKEYVLTSVSRDDTVDALCRQLSASLRHGVDVQYVVHQLEKTKGDMFSFSKALARTLKKYIQNGSKVSGETCSNCGNDSIERQDGCMVCKSCGSSKC